MRKYLLNLQDQGIIWEDSVRRCLQSPADKQGQSYAVTSQNYAKCPSANFLQSFAIAIIFYFFVFLYKESERTGEICFCIFLYCYVSRVWPISDLLTSHRN